MAAVAVGSALGDNAYVTHDNTYGPLSPPLAELLDLLRRIAYHDDARTPSRRMLVTTWRT